MHIDRYIIKHAENISGGKAKKEENQNSALPFESSSNSIHDDGATTKMLTISHVMFTLVNLNIFRGARYFLKRGKKENVKRMNRYADKILSLAFTREKRKKVCKGWLLISPSILK